MTNPDLQRAQDMLDAMRQQRDQALNANVLAHAQILSLQRDVAALQEQLTAATVEPVQETVAPTEE